MTIPESGTVVKKTCILDFNQPGFERVVLEGALCFLCAFQIDLSRVAEVEDTRYNIKSDRWSMLRVCLGVF